MQTKSLKTALWPYLSILFVLAVIFFIVGRLPGVRVGDGSEYYGMFYAWTVSQRPWMTAAAYQAYAALAASNTIVGLVPAETLSSTFEALRVGATSDFNHFWFYSFLAAAVAKVAALFAVTVGAHRSFLVVHFVALAVTAAIAYRYYRWKGVLALALMVAGSPVFWFINKAHTEFLTVCLTLSAVMLVHSRRYLPAALCLALASTQNPSFALIACVPLFYRVVLQRERSYSLLELALCIGVVLAVLVHPVYYFARYGVPTPQLLAGGAALGRNLGTFYIWIFDPDLGLLPNWPLGMGFLLLGGYMLAWQRLRARADASAPAAPAADRLWWIFVMAYLWVNFFAHASTTNLNSGATPGLARYALWYLPLAFPVLLYVIEIAARRRRQAWAGAAVLIVLLTVSVITNDPRKSERYTSPSLLSKFVQTNFPGSYNPPWEIFIERYSGFGEDLYAKKIRAIIGPDCAKMVVMAGEGQRDAIAPGACSFDRAKLNSYVNSPQFLLAFPPAPEPRYAALPRAQADAMRVHLSAGVHQLGIVGDGGSVLGEGWSGREPWGVWSESPVTTLVLPCDDSQFYGPSKPFTLALRLRPFNRQSIVISTSAGMAWQGAITEIDQEVLLALPAASCRQGLYTIRLQIPDAVSPLKLGLSADGRQLGIGLSQYEIRLR